MGTTMIFMFGMIIGSWIGITLLSCCHVAKKADKAMVIPINPGKSGRPSI